jgi:AhpD family alkylhydroperoxidase
MTKRIVSLVIASLSLVLSAPVRAEAPNKVAVATAEMRAQIGMVPTFMKKGLNEGALPSAWGMWKAIELDPNKAIPDKYISLMSLAVASQIPCRYCIIADREFAKAAGATEAELNEAVNMAALTRFWSTWLNGNQFDEGQFRKEADQILSAARRGPAPAGGVPIDVHDAPSALQDIKATFGMVPTFLKAFPDAALAPAWTQMKDVQLNPNTTIPSKYKELIGLAVAAQIPCRYCVVFHTGAAKLNGATERELKETLAEAALTRYFSTVLNGYGQDEASFRREIDGALRMMKKPVGTR